LLPLHRATALLCSAPDHRSARRCQPSSSSSIAIQVVSKLRLNVLFE
jgi:hypothetical protein